MLNEKEIRDIVGQGLGAADLDGKKTLVITPDATRSGPMPIMFRALADHILPRASRLDFLIALGTHMPLGEDAINRHYGLSDSDRAGRYKDIGIYNHRWDLPDTFAELGAIGSSEVEEISQGRMSGDVRVALNKLVLDYDHIVIHGPVFPHEVAGFSGGHKYLFPGIAESEIINMTHWLGALITNYEIIGTMDTPVRAMIERAADMLDVPRTAVCSVISGKTDVAGLFVGPVRDAWRRAAELSSRTHVRYVDRPYNLVISEMPEMYEDLWVGAKGMYKMEPAVADGGEIVIYAPHIGEVSYAHGKILDEVGYHVRDYFAKQWERFKDYPGSVLAHSTHGKGLGTFEEGVETPRVNVSLATGIPRERCERINLGFRDLSGFRLEDYEGREDEGILVVRRAGEILHRLKS